MEIGLECVEPVVALDGALLKRGFVGALDFALLDGELAAVGVGADHVLLGRLGKLVDVELDELRIVDYGAVAYAVDVVPLANGLLEPLIGGVEAETGAWLRKSERRCGNGVGERSLMLEDERYEQVVGLKRNGVVVECAPVVERDCRDFYLGGGSFLLAYGGECVP